MNIPFTENFPCHKKTNINKYILKLW